MLGVFRDKSNGSVVSFEMTGLVYCNGLATFRSVDGRKAKLHIPEGDYRMMMSRLDSTGRADFSEYPAVISSEGVVSLQAD